MLYKLNSPEEFEHNWPLTIEKYNLQNNKHVQGLYQIRHFWAPAYLRDYFFGGMTTTGRSESINAFIKRFISSHTSLMDFSKQVLIFFFEFCLLTSSLQRFNINTFFEFFLLIF